MPTPFRMRRFPTRAYQSHQSARKNATGCALNRRLYVLVPRIRITSLLAEVQSWTKFPRQLATDLFASERCGPDLVCRSAPVCVFCIIQKTSITASRRARNFRPPPQSGSALWSSISLSFGLARSVLERRGRPLPEQLVRCLAAPTRSNHSDEQDGMGCRLMPCCGRPILFASINDLNPRRLNDSTNELDAALVVHENRA